MVSEGGVVLSGSVLGGLSRVCLCCVCCFHCSPQRVLVECSVLEVHPLLVTVVAIVAVPTSISNILLGWHDMWQRMNQRGYTALKPNVEY